VIFATCVFVDNFLSASERKINENRFISGSMAAIGLKITLEHRGRLAIGCAGISGIFIGYI